MRRANAQLQSDRRAEILAAAERCFARSGFHQTSMQEICAEAGMSPGNLYRYFASKEALITGIVEANRAEAAASFIAVQQAPDFFAGLAALARHHLVERPVEKVAICAEVMAESRRTPEINELCHRGEQEIRQGLVDMLSHAAKNGEIDRDLDLEGAANVLMTLGDGISWRRAVDPSFDPETVLPMILHMVKCLLTEFRGTEKKEPSR